VSFGNLPLYSVDKPVEVEEGRFTERRRKRKAHGAKENRDQFSKH
jgi:hypothetical protein